MDYYRNVLGQFTWIPTPTLTEKNLADQKGRVVIITGANTGIGQQLASILYSSNATVYIAGRSPEKCNAAIEAIKSSKSTSSGQLHFLQLDLSDLTTIKASAESFLSREDRLDVLVNNAGVMIPPRGSKTAQGHELQLGTNCLGPYLFTQLLLPVLQKTAEKSPANSVRVAWAGSLAVDLASPVNGAEFDEGGKVVSYGVGEGKVASYGDQHMNYGLSKAGNRFLAKGLAGDDKTGKIVSVCFNPGNLRTELSRHLMSPSILKSILERIVGYAPIYGAYTELYAGFSPDVTTADNGGFIAPWGRKSFNRADVEAAMKGEGKGGSGVWQKFVDFCEAETKAFR